MIRCRDCKGSNVRIAMWVQPNTKEIFDDFGDWNVTDTNWCEDCKDHTVLYEEGAIDDIAVSGDTTTDIAIPKKDLATYESSYDTFIKKVSDIGIKYAGGPNPEEPVKHWAGRGLMDRRADSIICARKMWNELQITKEGHQGILHQRMQDEEINEILEKVFYGALLVMLARARHNRGMAPMDTKRARGAATMIATQARTQTNKGRQAVTIMTPDRMLGVTTQIEKGPVCEPVISEARSRLLQRRREESYEVEIVQTPKIEGSK